MERLAGQREPGPEGRVRVPQPALPQPFLVGDGPRPPRGVAGRSGPSSSVHPPPWAGHGRDTPGRWQPGAGPAPPRSPEAGWGGRPGRGAPPTRPPPPRPSAAEAPPQARWARWLRFWFHFLRSGLFPSPFPQPFDSLVPSPLASLSSNVTSSGRLSGTTLATGSSPQASLLIPSLLLLLLFFQVI